MSAVLELPASVLEQSGSTRASTRSVTRPLMPVAFHRRHTEALLRRYMKLSMQVGRMPSVLGDCVDRGMVSSRRIRSFEDGVIFVLDVETCLKRLDGFARALVRTIALQEYTQLEAARMLGISARTVTRRYSEALDALSELFLEAELLSAAPPSGCQESE